MTATRATVSNLDYDGPFIPVVTVHLPHRTGMCRALTATVAAAAAGALLQGGSPPTVPRP